MYILVSLQENNTLFMLIHVLKMPIKYMFLDEDWKLALFNKYLTPLQYQSENLVHLNNPFSKSFSRCLSVDRQLKISTPYCVLIIYHFLRSCDHNYAIMSVLREYFRFRNASAISMNHHLYVSGNLDLFVCLYEF